MAKIKQVVKRTGAVVPFRKERISNAIYRAAVAVGGRDRAIAENLADQVVAVLETQFGEDEIPAVEDVQNVVEKVLIENGHARTAKAYILYRDERARRRDEHALRAARLSENIPWRKIWHVLVWSVDHDLYTVDALNARIERGEFEQIVRETDHAYEDEVTCAAQLIVAQEEPVRIIVVAGPSSSGKTTTTKKLAHLLSKEGLSLVPLEVDNYFYDLEVHPRDEFGDYDYETPQALDLELINEHLQRLVEGEVVEIPRYNFRTGRRTLAQESMQVDSEDIILIDSLHGLHEEMMQDLDGELVFKIYIEPLMQMKGPDERFIRWTDLRLMRRMERDTLRRGYDARRTLEHWHYVRSSELRNIIPYVNAVDYVINSALPYELPIMKARLYEQFCQWVKEYRDDPLREDAYQRAKRVRDLLSGVSAVEDESLVPSDSLLREFIGGSCYEY